MIYDIKTGRKLEERSTSKFLTPYQSEIRRLEKAEEESWARCRELDRQATKLAGKLKFKTASKKQADRARRQSVQAQRKHHRLQELIFRAHRKRLSKVVRNED